MNGLKFKIIKTYIMIFVFVYCFNAFCTSVSDNDGSAFITKAEFDALKSSFQSQIDAYNQNIDSKIDTAIAAYLSGVRIQKETELITDFNDIKPDGAAGAGLYWNSTNGAYYTDTTYTVRWAISLQGYECGIQWVNSSGSTGTGTSYRYGGHHGDWQQNTTYNNVSGGYKDLLVSNDGSVINKLQKKAYYVTGNAHVVFGWNWAHESSTNKTIDLTSSCLDTSSNARDGNLKASNKATAPWSTAWYYDQGNYGYCVSSTTLFGEYEKDSSYNMCIYPLSTAQESYDNLSTKNLHWANTTTVGVNSAWGLSWGYATGASQATTRVGDVKLPRNATIDIFDQVESKNIKWDVLNKRCDKQAEIKKGIFLIKIDNNGDLGIKYQLSQKGWVFFWKGTDPDVKWGGGRSSETDTSWKVTSNSHYVNSTSEQTFNITDVSSGDNIWVMYIPDSSSNAKLTINKLLLTTE